MSKKDKKDPVPNEQRTMASMRPRKEEMKMGKWLDKFFLKDEETKSKKKIENIVFLIIILIITLIIINTIWKGDINSEKETNNNNDKTKVLASLTQEAADEGNTSGNELEKRLENILSTVKNVGNVNVLINYSESSSIVPLYNESTTVSGTEEGDSSGGTRNVTETETKKDVVFSESSGNKEPYTQKTVMPEIKGAIVTAEGAADITVKTNIINAVSAVTGLGADKIQVFQMK